MRDAPSSCNGKHGFRSHGLANETARRSARRKDKSLSAYRCEHCGLWHIGQNNTMRRKHK